MGTCCDANWRLYHPTPTAKLYHLLTSSLHTDVTFSLSDGHTISCHKLVLIASSEVFEAMLTGSLKENSPVIEISDVSSECWSLMLEFLYTSTFSATIQNAVELMYAAKKYDLPELTSRCSELLKSDLTEKNAVTIYQAAQLLEDKELEGRAEAWVIRNLHKVMEEESDFLNITKDNLKTLLAKDDLDIAELDLFQSVIKWSSFSSGASDSPQHELIHDILPLIRFPLMSPEDFSISVVPTGVLDLEKCVVVLQHLSCSKDKRSFLPPLPYSSKPRNTNLSYTAHFAVRLTDMVYPYVSHILYYDSFEVDCPISILQLGFPAPDLDDATYDVAVQILVQSTNTLVVQTNQSIVCKRRSVMRVAFEQPVRVEAGIMYKVIYKLKGPDTFYADQRNPNVKCESKSVNTYS